MRQKLTAVIVFFAVVIVIFAINFVTRHKGAAPITGSSICTTFIYDAENMKAQDAYNLFSQTLQSQIPYTEWEQQLRTLNASLGAAAPQFNSQQTVTDDSGAIAYKRLYTLTNYGTQYSVTCTYTTATSGYVIDNFSSFRAKANN